MWASSSTAPPQRSLHMPAATARASVVPALAAAGLAVAAAPAVHAAAAFIGAAGPFTADVVAAAANICQPDPADPGLTVYLFAAPAGLLSSKGSLPLVSRCTCLEV